jgi:DNA ligase 1
MKRFAALYEALDGTTSTNAKVAALVAYFASAPAADAAWALYFLTGRRFKRFLSTALLCEWTLGLTGLPSWLFEDAYATVGDLAETIALLLDHPSHTPSTEELPLSRWIEERLLPLRGLDDMEQRQAVCRWWQALARRQLFLLNKLLTGAFRVGVSETLVVRAVAQMAGLPPATVAHRLMGEWTPSAAFFQELTAQEAMDDDRSRPYPFCLAYQLDQDVAQLGNRDDWLAEWKWDGIRAQLIRRGDAVYLWSRGEELVTDRFPELREAGLLLPEGTVLDGEIVAFRDGVPLPFSTLQHRIGRQRLTAKVLTEVPMVFLNYDLLEADGMDLRACMLSQRRARLAHLLAQGSPHLLISPALDAPSWDALAQRRRESRARHVEGSCPCGLRINRVCLSGATTRSSMVRPWPLPFGSQGLVKSTYPACGRRCAAQPYDRQPHSLLTALVAGATVARGTGAPLSGARHDRSGLLPWPAYRDATVWASHSLWWARAVVTVGVGWRAATRSYSRRDRGPVAGVSLLHLCIKLPCAARWRRHVGGW